MNNMIQMLYTNHLRAIQPPDPPRPPGLIKRFLGFCGKYHAEIYMVFLLLSSLGAVALGVWFRFHPR